MVSTVQPHLSSEMQSIQPCKVSKQQESWNCYVWWYFRCTRLVWVIINHLLSLGRKNIQVFCLSVLALNCMVKNRTAPARKRAGGCQQLLLCRVPKSDPRVSLGSDLHIFLVPGVRGSLRWWHMASLFAGEGGIWKKKHLCTKDGSKKGCWKGSNSSLCCWVRASKISSSGCPGSWGINRRGTSAWQQGW